MSDYVKVRLVEPDTGYRLRHVAIEVGRKSPSVCPSCNQLPFSTMSLKTRFLQSQEDAPITFGRTYLDTRTERLVMIPPSFFHFHEQGRGVYAEAVKGEAYGISVENLRHRDLIVTISVDGGCTPIILFDVQMYQMYACTHALTRVCRVAPAGHRVSCQRVWDRDTHVLSEVVRYVDIYKLHML